MRKALKGLGLDFKVKASTVSFSGLGYGSMPFAEVETARLLDYVQCSTLADALRKLRVDPAGGKGIVRLNGRAYAFGGAIGYMDYPSGIAFWNRVGLDLTAQPMVNTAVIREAERRVKIAYAFEKPSLPKDVWCRAWIQSGIDSPENWAKGWPDIYDEDEAPAGWPGIASFNGEATKS